MNKLMETLGYSEPEDKARGRLHPEPTVTMATKEALAAINDMFMSDLPHEARRRY